MIARETSFLVPGAKVWCVSPKCEIFEARIVSCHDCGVVVVFVLQLGINVTYETDRVFQFESEACNCAIQLLNQQAISFLNMANEMSRRLAAAVKKEDAAGGDG